MYNIKYLNSQSKYKNVQSAMETGINAQIRNEPIYCRNLAIYEIASAGRGCEVSLIQTCELRLLVEHYVISWYNTLEKQQSLKLSCRHNAASCHSK